jgi:hypothetical protein
MAMVLRSSSVFAVGLSDAAGSCCLSGTSALARGAGGGDAPWQAAMAGIEKQRGANRRPYRKGDVMAVCFERVSTVEPAVKPAASVVEARRD